MPPLPERTPTAEDDYVRCFSQVDADAGELVDAIEQAMEDHRPLLAARLVTLLDGHVEIVEGSALHRAQQAARFVVFNRPSPEDRSWSSLEDAWREAREGRLRRFGQRQRNRMSGKAERIGRRTSRNRRLK